MYAVFFFRLSILLSLFFSCNLHACSEAEACIEKSSWQLGVAFGLGVKTNPLVGGDNIPLVILPDIAWYAEKAYFDNGELGYQWINQSQIALETFIQVDRERAFFSFFHPNNIFSQVEFNTSISAPSPQDAPENIKPVKTSISIDDIAKRKWSINGGVRGHYFLPNGEWQLTLQQDLSSVHNGNQLGLEYSHRWIWQTLRLKLSIGADWKSARLIDYYYGVSEKDTKHSEFYFNGTSGWQPYLHISMSKPINESWLWLANIGYRRLPNSLTNSPLVEKRYISNVFLGAAYRF